MKFGPRLSKLKLWNGFPLFSVFGGLYLNLLKSSLRNVFKSFFSVLKTQFIHTFNQNHLLYTCSIPGPQAINWGIAENKARSSSHRRRRQWHPIPLFLPGKSHGRRSLVGWSPWGHYESDTTERLSDFTFHFYALEKEMATHSSVLAWRIPGTGEPDGLPSMGSHRVGHDWSDLAAAAAAAAPTPTWKAHRWPLPLQQVL